MCYVYYLLSATILDKTVEKIVYLDSIFLNIVAVPVLPSPPSPESNVVVYSKESLIPGRLWEATLNWGKGFSFRKGVVLEIVLLCRKVDIMGKTFSSSFVRDCSSIYELLLKLLLIDMYTPYTFFKNWWFQLRSITSTFIFFLFQPFKLHYPSTIFQGNRQPI